MKYFQQPPKKCSVGPFNLVSFKSITKKYLKTARVKIFVWYIDYKPPRNCARFLFLKKLYFLENINIFLISYRDYSYLSYSLGSSFLSASFIFILFSGFLAPNFRGFSVPLTSWHVVFRLTPDTHLIWPNSQNGISAEESMICQYWRKKSPGFSSKITSFC